MISREFASAISESAALATAKIILRVVLFALVLIVAAFFVGRATAAPRVNEWQVTQSRGSTANYLIFKGATAQEALDKCIAATPQNSNPATTYSCNPPKLVMVLTPPTPCPPAPTRPGTCPAGSTGSWTETASVSPAPACVVTWPASSPPSGSCTPTTPVPVSGTAELTWNHVANTARVIGFRVYWGVGPTQTRTSKDFEGSALRSASINGLSAGTYNFSVTAYGPDGESDPSNVVSKVVR